MQNSHSGVAHNSCFPAFYPIIDTSVALSAGITSESVAKALMRAGVRVAQFRHKGNYDSEIIHLAEKVGNILHEFDALYIVNDRPDVALCVGADGVHVGQDDLPPVAVRTVFEALPIQKTMTIGLSVHNEQQLRQADLAPLDYLAIGPIFTTNSKINPDPTIGLEELHRLRALTSKHVVAIGGITRENAREVFAAGADSVAVISDFISSDIDDRLSEWLRVVKFSAAS